MLIDAAAATQGPPPHPGDRHRRSPARVPVCQGPSVASHPVSTWGADGLDKFTFLEWTPEVGESTTPNRIHLQGEAPTPDTRMVVIFAEARPRRASAPPPSAKALCAPFFGN